MLRFEGMLKYVALPRLEWDDEDDMEIGQSDSEPEDTDFNVAGTGGSSQPEKAGKRYESTPFHSLLRFRQQAPRSKGKGLWAMCPIFAWLEQQRVKSVLKVAVIDDAYPSHSDRAIEKCLNRFDIRVWNWYKVDLCCSVILKAAKRARDVTLYSSGNNAVLMGWSSPEGLPKLGEVSDYALWRCQVYRLRY